MTRKSTSSGGPDQPPASRDSLGARLTRPVDAASLAVFRIAFGLILLWEVSRYFAHGWIARYYIDPVFHFTYFGFDWVRPWAGVGMYIHFAVLGLAALLVAIGLWYRGAIVVLWLAFTYVFLLDEARYLNHFYAVSLFAFLLMFIPAERAFSVDAWRRRGGSSATVPVWTLWLMRFQIGVIYFYGGLAKINHDWIRGEPMRSWLLARSDLPLIDLIVRSRLELYVFSYGGLLFDLLVTPALLWRRTRPFAFAAAIVFHVINSQLFSIGIFPWMMIAATTLFFDAHWPRRFWARAGRTSDSSAKVPAAGGRPLPTLALAALALYCVVQLVVPLRRFLYPGNVSWTEEGHRFSWSMKLREKEGLTQFYVLDRSNGRTTVVSPSTILADWQVGKMSTRPDMILQFAHYLASEYGAPERPIEVRAQALVSLNGEGTRPLVDPSANLAAESRTLWPAWWVTRGGDVDAFGLAKAAGGNSPVRIR